MTTSHVVMEKKTQVTQIILPHLYWLLFCYYHNLKKCIYSITILLKSQKNHSRKDNYVFLLYDTEYLFGITRHREYTNISMKLLSSYKSTAFLQASNQCDSSFKFTNLW